ncbi:MAG TPA: hypothetical protein DHW31_05290 [Bacteroides graminisolvens]|uniref:DUF6808 domain-containing protein n=1 Tax=Bacteroides graminisolvens TaxID=477666 RepID=A0A3D2SEC3_9BACE|nr:hypothetical protein [Bacteroides graminisolvens]
MKALPWILVMLLIIGCLFLYFHPQKTTHSYLQRDTIVKIDTVRDTVPVPYKVRVVRVDTVYFPILVGDTASVDSIPVAIPITQKEYKTNQYQAWVSGYRPNLDSIHTFIPMTTIYVKQKVRRWGVGLQAGYGYPSGVYVGVGVNYNLWQW